MPQTLKKTKFWPGYKWFILAHKKSKGKSKGSWVCTNCEWKGDNIKKHPSKKDEKDRENYFCKSPLDKAIGREGREVHLGRELIHSDKVTLSSTDIVEEVQFDELVIDDWFHLEQMNERDYWIGVGDPSSDNYHHINIHINEDGSTSVLIEKQ